MNYTGDYITGTIHGTLNNEKIKVTTATENSYLLCALTVNFNSEVWTHTFEVPFFNGDAELYFANYIHSLMTQKFNNLQFLTSQITTHSFDLANVSVVITERKDGADIDEHTIEFYYMIGKFTPFLYSSISGTNVIFLPVNTTKIFTRKALFGFTFLAAEQPDKVVVNGVEIAITSQPTIRLLHSIIVPIDLVVGSTVEEFTFKIKFPSGAEIDAGSIYVLENGVDHNLMFYQNEFGALSTIEFTGEITFEDAFKSDDFSISSNGNLLTVESKIDLSNIFKVNTGYIFDESKHKMITTLLKSFNRFSYDNNQFTRVTLNGTHKLSPYQSGLPDYNEDLNFKISENDNIYYGTI